MTANHIQGNASHDTRETSSRKLKEYAAFLAILLLFGLFLAHKQDLSIADIGRHIRNGEYFFTDPQVLRTNYYSYTEPGFPVMNHHWGSGVLFYLIWKTTGFKGLHVLYAALYLLCFGLFFQIARKKSGLFAAGLSAIAVIPLLALRTEIRPEIFSYLLAGSSYWLLTEWRGKKIDYLFVLLPMMEICWVNLHIYFILGPVIVGIFWLESVYHGQDTARKLFYLLILTSLASLLNPFGVQGAIAPFTIFQNYSFSVAENTPVWSFDQVEGIFAYDTLYFKIVFILLVASFIVAAIKRPREIPASRVLLAAVFSSMAWFALRNISLFGLFALPIMANNAGFVLDKTREGLPRFFLPTVLLVLAAAIVLYSRNMLSELFHLPPETGFGMAQENPAAAEFVRKNKLQGPIFNDYDIGGYLIYYLFPQERVFVDNRPEAYPSAFFRQQYFPLLTSEGKWRELDSRIGFRTIIVSRRDADLSYFLDARLRDPHWLCVYEDPFILIFIKR